jgi:hypothetical protein
MLNKALLAAYRCPEEFCSYTLAEELSLNSGYFRFGGDILYGRCVGRPSEDSDAPYEGLTSNEWSNDGRFALPFDPNAVIDSLLHERYAKGELHSRNKLLHQAYYLARPFLPVSVRRHIQKFHLKNPRKQAFPSWPVDSTVDRLLEHCLAASLRALWEPAMPFVWFWPKGYSSCAIITHDVETEQGLEFCSRLMDIDDSFGIKSSFQLVPEQRYKVSERVLRNIQDRGFEINIHDLNHDGHLYSDRTEFLRRAAKINEYARNYGARGFRSGAMYRNLDWYDEFEFSYDMSVPTVGHLEAQQGGCCTVRPYFVKNIVELPLTTIQDYSLFHILNDYSIDLWKQQIQTIMAEHGLVSFIIHPDYVMEKRAQDVYKALLTYLSELRAERGMWIARPGEVASWWRQRDDMTISTEGGKLSIAGPAHEDVRVADAYLSDDGSVAYRYEPVLNVVETGEVVVR